MGEIQRFTANMLSQYSGAGKPAYIAYKGKVYDVTDSVDWPNGDHFGQHMAGRDLTNELVSAPHGEEEILKYKVVGLYEIG